MFPGRDARRRTRPGIFGSGSRWQDKRLRLFSALCLIVAAVLVFLLTREPLPPPPRRKVTTPHEKKIPERERTSWALVGKVESGDAVDASVLVKQDGSTGEVQSFSVAGTTWVEQRWPLNAPSARSCPTAVNEGLRFKSTYALTDRMNDRSTQEPSFRFVQLVHAVPNQPRPIEFGHLLPQDKQLACSHLDSLRTETLPEGGCPPDAELKEPFPGGPWCAPWDASVFIGELTCGFMQSCAPHPDMAFMVIASSGAVMSHKKFTVSFPPDSSVPLQEFEVLATPGYAEYADAPGHFNNELLPRLLHLDRHLPVDVPLVWPAGSIPEFTLELFQEVGLMSRKRKHVFFPTTGHVSFVRAKKLYFYGTTTPLVISPVVTWLSQRALAASYSLLADRLVNVTSVWHQRESSAKAKVLYLQRPGKGSRTLTNEAELMAALTADGSPASATLDIVPFVATTHNFPETVLSVREADVIIGVHGANLNNIMFAREGAAVVEIGFLQQDFHLPSDYLCLGRNLGLHYWTVFPISGGHAAPVEADVPKTVTAILKAAAQANPRAKGSKRQ